MIMNLWLRIIERLKRYPQSSVNVSAGTPLAAIVSGAVLAVTLCGSFVLLILQRGNFVHLFLGGFCCYQAIQLVDSVMTGFASSAWKGGFRTRLGFRVSAVLDSLLSVLGLSLILLPIEHLKYVGYALVFSTLPLDLVVLALDSVAGHISQSCWISPPCAHRRKDPLAFYTLILGRITALALFVSLFYFFAMYDTGDSRKEKRDETLISVGSTAPRLPIKYPMSEGETLQSIARAFLVSPRDIMELNDLTDSNAVKPNMTLLIPVAQ